MALNLNTYGDLKKAIKAIALKQKGQAIVSQGKSFALDQVLGLIPGASNAKTTYDFIKSAISKPDTKKTNTWLDKLDIDDNMSRIVDDTVENGFMKAMAASIESEADDKSLEPDFNMNAKMVNYLKQQYQGRTVSGIKENKEMDLKEFIKSLVRKELDEESVAADAGPYMTPRAFAGKRKGDNKATKAAEGEGMKKAKKPTKSKVLDYKKLYQESDYDKASISSQPSPYDKASGYTGVGGDNHQNQYYKESLDTLIKNELLNESSYNKFKREVTFRTKSEQLHKAIREVKRKLAEIDRIVEYTSRMKQELSEGEEGVRYWKATQNNVARISEMVNHLNNKIKNLQQ